MKANFLTIPLLSLVLNLQASPREFQFDIDNIPFSKSGSYLVFATGEGEIPGAINLFLREVSGKYAWGDDRIFRIELELDGEVLRFSHVDASPHLLTARTGTHTLEICFEDNRTIRFRSSGASLIITKVMEDPRHWEWVIPVGENQTRIHGGFDKYALTAVKGNLVKLVGERKVVVSGDFALEDDRGRRVWAQFRIDPGSRGECEAALERYTGGWAPRVYTKPFSQCANDALKDFEDFYHKNPGVPETYTRSAIEAAYVNWSSLVEPRGLLKRPTMFMSKDLMRHVWSWDHCFNALALAYGNPRLAWDQFMVFFDLQDETGALLDYVNDHHGQIDFVKPPIHGWTLQKMLDIGMVTLEMKQEIYAPLAKWTNFWFNFRDDDGDGLPQYNHGNDSGWDNGTPFNVGYPVEGCDLAAYLIIQMDVLSRLANDLGRTRDSEAWKARADELLERLVGNLWCGDRFVSTRSGDGAITEDSRSLMLFLPMVLGRRLPDHIREELLERFRESGLVTQYGPASEHVESPHYKEDGYWQGAIWPSATLLITEGVNNCGDRQLAVEIARKYADLCEKSGFRENHDAVTGRGLRDYGYTWTASCFLVLAHEYLLKEVIE